MKNILLKILFLIPIFSISQTPCESGFAGEYPCNGFDLQDAISLGSLNADSGNDSWGWTDPTTGKEYAIVGLNNGTAFIDISNPTETIYLGKLPTHSSNSTWRDIKVYNNYAFIVSEADDHGMQVFDLTRLRDVSAAPVNFTEDAHYDGFGDAHNIIINEETGYAYAVGTNTYSGGPHFVNIQNPLSPIAAGGYSSSGYSHDGQVITYNGPDTEHLGKELFIGSNEDVIVIIDVTDKTSPVSIKTVVYSNVGYTHQGWITEDHTYFFLGDEIDELNFGFNTHTIIFDFSDLDNPSLHMEYVGPNPSIDHNGYIKGDKFYLSNYSSGLRVLDISDLASGSISEIGFFDSYPNNNNANFRGAWNVYPFFESGNIIISDINRGFFLVKDATLAVNEFASQSLQIFPNPTSNFLEVSIDGTPIKQIDVYSLLGSKVLSFNNINANTTSIDVSSLSKGVYAIAINNSTIKKFIKN